jgi:hypothetical protein
MPLAIKEKRDAKRFPIYLLNLNLFLEENFTDISLIKNWVVGYKKLING